MTTHSSSFAPFLKRMRAHGLPEVFINSFAHYYELLHSGQTGLISEAAITPVTSLVDAECLPQSLVDSGHSVLPKTAVIKLNGGLGTSMGLDRAKSLLKVKDGLSFLDITARQARHAQLPLILMNSFATHSASLAALQQYQDVDKGIPRAFLQHRAPKIRQADLAPVDWPEERELEWCPPGHGDIYVALVTSGTLDALLDSGYEFAFVSNADNLGAVIDARILGYFAENGLPFMMEAAERTEMDRKGGHLARNKNGRLILRELAQTPNEDQEAFQDIEQHRFFNTNNLWINLPALRRVMISQNNALMLPMIRNGKTTDPRDESTPPVFHLETAMGSAIAVFEGAQALRVPRRRFAPVKRSSDLLAVRSDAFLLTNEFHIVPNPEREVATTVVDLDARYYRFVNDLDARFPSGVPSLVNCRRLEVNGDFIFGRDVKCVGDVRLLNNSGGQVAIPDGALLSGEKRY